MSNVAKYKYAILSNAINSEPFPKGFYFKNKITANGSAAASPASWHPVKTWAKCSAQTIFHPKPIFYDNQMGLLFIAHSQTKTTKFLFLILN